MMFGIFRNPETNRGINRLFPGIGNAGRVTNSNLRFLSVCRLRVCLGYLSVSTRDKRRYTVGVGRGLTDT